VLRDFIKRGFSIFIMDSYTTTFAHSAHLFRALGMLPVLPKQSRFEFFAHEIALPKTGEGQEMYLEQCKEKQVLPYTMLSVVYDFRNRVCVPLIIEQATPHRINSVPQEQKLLMEGMLRGGKVHQIQLEVGVVADVEMLGYLAEQVLADFVAQQYVLHQGDMWLTQYRICRDGYGKGTAISVQSHSPLEMKLQLASPISERELEVLVGWFERVKRK